MYDRTWNINFDAWLIVIFEKNYDFDLLNSYPE